MESELATDSQWHEFAHEFISARNEALEGGDVEGFVWQYVWLFDNFLAKSPAYEGFDAEEIAEHRVMVARTAREYANQHCKV